MVATLAYSHIKLSFVSIRLRNIQFFFVNLSGPRFVLNLIRIFDGSFGGPTLYENTHYTNPNEVSIYFVLYARLNG